MSGIFRAVKSCMSDWKRLTILEREHLLNALDMPLSEAACKWEDLRPQVRYAMIEHEIANTEAIAL